MRIGIAGPMDIRMLSDLFPAGTDIPDTYRFPLVSHLARELYNRGHEIVLFALSKEITAAQVLTGSRISAYICPQRRPRWQMLDFFRAERHGLRDAMRASRCDVVHAHWSYEFGSAATGSGLPHVVTAHDVPMVVLRFARHPYWLEKPLLAVSALRKAQCVTAVSPYVARQLEGFLRPQKDVMVVPNGVAADVFSLAERHAARKGDDTIVFASVLSGWDLRKNPKPLIRGFAKLREELGNRAELWMLGRGFEAGGPAEQWARRNHAEAGIRFIGPMPHSEVLKTLADDVDILAHPSLEEACCMAVIEAMAIGLPVIGGHDAGGIPWQLDSGKAGLLVDVKSPSSLAAGMRRLVEDPAFRNSLGRSARQKALQDFRLESVAVPYERVLTKIAQEKKK